MNFVVEFMAVVIQNTTMFVLPFIKSKILVLQNVAILFSRNIQSRDPNTFAFKQVSLKPTVDVTDCGKSDLALYNDYTLSGGGVGGEVG